MLGKFSKKNVPWGTTNYTIPKPYLRPRLVNKSPEIKHIFAKNPADGPAYTVSKSKRNPFFHINTYGKDCNGPPHTYLAAADWNIKSKTGGKDLSMDQKKKLERGSMFDMILHDAKKYGQPGPSSYFKELNMKKHRGESQSKKQIPNKPSFVDDIEYLGINNPSPNSYKFKDLWGYKGKSRRIEDKTKLNSSVNVSPRGSDRGPGRYEIVRMYTLRDDQDKSKAERRFISIPNIERITLGVIPKVV